MENKVTDRVRSKAHSYCSSILGEGWSRMKPQDLIIESLPHGLTNELFVCSLPDTCQDASIRKAVLRLYGKTLTSDTSMQIKIFEILAAKNLGPKLYGFFPEGRLEEYLPSQPLTAAQIRNPQISSIIARKIAHLQNVKIPNLQSDRNWIISNCFDFYKHFEELSNDNFKKLIANLPIQTQQVAEKLVARKGEIRKEIEFLNSVISKSEMPLVFSNNDLHQNNILLVDKSISKADLFDRIVLIDFDYSCENYSAFDLANHFAEWRFDYHIEEYPYMEYSDNMFPTKEQMRLFVSEYLNECKASKRNSSTSNENPLLAKLDEVDAFIEELEPFVFASDLLWSLWGIKMAIQCPDRPAYWHFGGARMNFFFLYKERYIAKQKWLQTEQSKL